MSGLAWSHSCTVGVQAMDDQHGILMDTLNELRQQLVRGGDREQIALQLRRLVEFTGMHFDCEEGLLARYGFPGLDDHRAEHQRLLREITQAVEQAEFGETSDLQPLFAFLRSWYINHVERLDRQYGEWLNAHGVY